MSMQLGGSRKQTHCSGPIPTTDLSERGKNIAPHRPNSATVKAPDRSKRKSRRLSIPVDAELKCVCEYSSNRLLPHWRVRSRNLVGWELEIC